MYIWVKRGGFQLPAADVPLICVGPGTGIAPFRSMCFERQAQNVDPKAPILVLFGNRNRAKDFLYEEEWKELQEDGSVQDVLTAFSRDQDEKIYVTHVMKRNTELIWDFLERGAAFFVAG